MRKECTLELVDDNGNVIPNNITKSPNDVVKRGNDVIEVVRCKDCIHKYVSGNGITQYYVCDFMDAQYEEDGFCRHGESEVEK